MAPFQVRGEWAAAHSVFARLGDGLSRDQRFMATEQASIKVQASWDRTEPLLL